jgi:UDPglucose--hexose-1-phosphate uridylyltransferase
MADEIPFHVPWFRVRPLAEPELRKDPVVERWVIVSTDRLSRTQELHAVAPVERLEACPFCAGHEFLTCPATLEIPHGSEWRVRVVPNKFPAVRGLGEPRTWSDGWHEGITGIGRHEVVIECPHHEKSLANLAADHVANLLRAYQQRIQQARLDRRLVYPMIFKNSGADAGASLEHSHSQILTLAQIPRTVQEELDGAKKYFDGSGRCLYCDWWRQEQSFGERQLLDTEHFTVFLPYAGRFPFEMCILPKMHQSQFDEFSKAESAELGSVLRRVLRKLQQGMNDPPYNYLLHTAPLHSGPLPHYHWHLEILPRITGVAGFEWGTGYFVNPVPPEQAAQYLRGVKDE